jgi:hypothetical protein
MLRVRDTVWSLRLETVPSRNYPGREVLGRLDSETSISFEFVVMISHVFAIGMFQKKNLWKNYRYGLTHADRWCSLRAGIYKQWQCIYSCLFSGETSMYTAEAVVLYGIYNLQPKLRSVFVYAVVHGIQHFLDVTVKHCQYIYLPQGDLYVYSRCCGTQYLYLNRALFTLLYYSLWSGGVVTVHGIRCRVEPEAPRDPSTGSSAYAHATPQREKMLSYRRMWCPAGDPTRGV